MISMNQAIKELTFAGEYKPLPSQDVVNSARINENLLIRAGFSDNCRRIIYNNSEVMCFVHSRNPLKDFSRIINHLRDGFPKFCSRTQKVIAGALVGVTPKFLDSQRQNIENGESCLAENNKAVYHIRLKQISKGE